MPLRERLRPFLVGGRGLPGWETNDIFAEREGRTKRAQAAALPPSVVHTSTGGLTTVATTQPHYALVDALSVSMDVGGAVFLYSDTFAETIKVIAALFIQGDDGKFRRLDWSLFSQSITTAATSSRIEVFIALTGTLPANRPLLVSTFQETTNVSMSAWTAKTYDFRKEPSVTTDDLPPNTVLWSGLVDTSTEMPAVSYVSTSAARGMGFI